jgi:hypothetical protein
MLNFAERTGSGAVYVRMSQKENRTRYRGPFYHLDFTLGLVYSLSVSELDSIEVDQCYKTKREQHLGFQRGPPP